MSLTVFVAERSIKILRGAKKQRSLSVKYRACGNGWSRRESCLRVNSKIELPYWDRPRMASVNFTMIVTDIDLPASWITLPLGGTQCWVHAPGASNFDFEALQGCWRADIPVHA